MPSDITGTEIIDQDPATGKRNFRFVRGPIFSNIVLADEINRTPPKTQAALLQAMQEYEVTVGRQHLQAGAAVLRDGHAEPHRAGRDLSAARSPVGPLHALDQHRLPDADAKSARSSWPPRRRPGKRSQPVLQGQDILGSSSWSARCRPASTWSITRWTWSGRRRPEEPYSPDFVKNWLAWGAGPRAAQYMF